MNVVFNNVKYVSGRFFIDIASSGCGSNCNYCYISNAYRPQVLLNQSILKNSLDYIKNHLCYNKGQYGSIISLCPNTEPFKSTNSSNLILFILKYFLPLGNPIQISTKELIPISILDFCQKNCLYSKQVFFNISTSSITKQSIIEPFACPIETRFKNIENIKKYPNLIETLYIKPFTIYTFNDLDHYIKYINLYSPKYVCIGIDFKKNTILNKPCDLLYHNNDIINKAFDENIKDKFLYFTNKIEDLIKKTVYHSSICIISNALNIPSKLNLHKNISLLCKNCLCCNTNRKV